MGKNISYFVCIGDVDRLATLRHVANDARSPRYANLLLLFHLLQSGLRTHVEKFGDEATRLRSALSLHQEQGTSIGFRQDADVLERNRETESVSQIDTK